MEGFEWRTLRDLSPVYAHKCKVRFQDVDAAGFMFFAQTFGYFHDAWLAFIEDGGLKYSDVVNAHQWGAPLRHVEADYLSPLRFGDDLEVGLVRAAFDGSDLYVGFRVTSNGRVAAVGMTHHVVIGIAERARIEPPPQFREVFRRLEVAGPTTNG
jgi:YbgC/YbaW family acyl-CoA thioester hydrolase